MNIFEKWAFAKPLIETAVAQCRGTHTMDDICLMVGAGHFTLWTGTQSAVLTEFVHYPRMIALNYFMVCGDYAELMKMKDTTIEPQARARGVTRVQGGGRDGWSRKLPGFTHGGTFMYKDI